METITTKNEKLINFYNKYINHLQKTVLDLDDNIFNKFINLLKKHNIYIVGRSIIYYCLDLDYYNDTLDLFINIDNLNNFLNELYYEFIYEECNFSSKYGNYDDNIIEIVYTFINNKNKRIRINLYVYKLYLTEHFLEVTAKNFSIFKILLDIKKDSFYGRDEATKIFKKEGGNIIYIKTNINYINNEEEEILLSKGIGTTYIEEPEYKFKDYESRLVKELISNLNIYDKTDVKKINIIQYRDILYKIIGDGPLLFETTATDKFITGENANKKFKILIVIKFILDMYDNYSLLDNPMKQLKSFVKTGYETIYTYERFKQTYYNIFSKSMFNKLNNYIDTVIKEKILSKYNINMDINNNKIKFNITDSDKRELNINTENYIKQVLLFYYKNRIYKHKYDYNFINIILDKFNLFNIVNNLIEFETTFDEKVVRFSKAMIGFFYKSKKVSKKLDPIEYKKTITHDSKKNYTDLILGDEITDIKTFLAEDKENIIIIDNSKINATCISKKDLDQLVSNYADNWFFDCSKYKHKEHLLTPYIKLPLISYTCYVPYNDLYSLFESKKRVFYINTTDLKIEKTASYKNTIQLDDDNDDIEPNWTGANHCQEGSTIEISRIITIKEEVKVKKEEKSKISLNKSYSISLTSN
jgi:hypothetical protein